MSFSWAVGAAVCPTLRLAGCLPDLKEAAGLLAHACRRKIARLLLFANLVPLAPLELAAEAAPASPKVRGCITGTRQP